MRKKTVLIALLALFVALSLHWYFFQEREIVRNVFDRPLGPCVVEWFKVRKTLIFACPHMDSIRLWPLPMQQPWFEDPIDPDKQDAFIPITIFITNES